MMMLMVGTVLAGLAAAYAGTTKAGSAAVAAPPAPAAG
ncbi:hypothetical protein FHT01_001160 [Sphingomonas japonica]|uniref:Uncharacterized protein n=1 Tax=Sphingomonas japonica TaxID=511662 RepID=A0ABX0TZ76_9SPHN|nr:hypothetical protein [Sphingomonas japonica]